MARDTDGVSEERRAQALIETAKLKVELEEWDGVFDAFREALAIYRKLATEDSRHEVSVAETLRELGQLHCKAAATLECALRGKATTRVLMPDGAVPPDASGEMLGQLSRAQEVHRCQAENEYAEALEILRRLPLEDLPAHEDALAEALTRIGGFHLMAHRLAEAERALTEAFEIRHRKAPEGEDDGGLAFGLRKLALTLKAAGRKADAERFMEMAAERYKAEHERTGDKWLWTAWALTKTGTWRLKFPAWRWLWIVAVLLLVVAAWLALWPL